MKIEKINPRTKYLYHYTLKENVEIILKDKAIISKDDFIAVQHLVNNAKYGKFHVIFYEL